MIKSFAHKGLEAFFLTGSKKGIHASHAARLGLILGLLDGAENVGDVNAPTLALHPLKGKLADHWAVTVRANWRIIFKFKDRDAYLVDYLDYH